LVITLTGGDRNDVTQLIPLVDTLPVIGGRRGRPWRRPRHLYADRGYDHDKYRRILRARGITPVIARRSTGHGSGLGKLRWPVERSFAWLHAFKRLRTRYERRAEIHQALLSLACSVICLRKLILNRSLTLVAAHTTTVKVASGIIILPLRNAVGLAEELTSLDRVAAGRLIVGVGPGYVPEECAAVCVAMSEWAARTAVSAAVSTSTLPVARASDSCTRSGSCASVTSTPKCQPCTGLSETALPTADITAAAGHTA
jgi:transposase